MNTLLIKPIFSHKYGLLYSQQFKYYQSLSI